MIELRDANALEMTYTLYCPECEKRFGIRQELRMDMKDRSDSAVKWRNQILKRFDTLHALHEDLSEEYDSAISQMDRYEGEER